MAPESGAGNAPPIVTSFGWRPAPPIPAGHSPVPGDPVHLTCAAADPEREALTLVLEQTAGAGCLIASRDLAGTCGASIRASFHAGAPAAVLGAIYVSARDTSTRATFRCTATDARGLLSLPVSVCVPLSSPAGQIRCH
jgi:hypothetical protein